MKIRVGYEDGNHWAVPYTEGHEKAGLAFVEMGDDEWARYQLFRALDREWNQRLLGLGNTQYAADHPDDAWAQEFCKEVAVDR